MKHKFVLIATFMLILAGLTACSNNNDGHENKASYDADSANNADADMDHSTEESKMNDSSGNKNADETTGGSADSQSDRMIIYTANMTITITDFQQTQDKVQSLVEDEGGLIVNSNVSTGNEDNRQGQLTVRVPEEKFDGILDQIGEMADEVIERNVNGEDVTKKYVDLESRLKAKQDVKKRLETLMEEAGDTDDLLDISNKLGETQKKIETIKGEMAYLDNHSAMSTINLSMQEDNVQVKKQEDLNTWEKTKQALVTSTNAIMTFFSGVVIFLIGYSPILIPILIIAAVAYWLYRRRKK